VAEQDTSVGGCDAADEADGTSLAAGCRAAALGLLSGEPGGEAIALATGVNLNLEMNPRESGGCRRHKGPDGLTQAQGIPGVCRGLIWTRMGPVRKIWQENSREAACACESLVSVGGGQPAHMGDNQGMQHDGVALGSAQGVGGWRKNLVAGFSCLQYAYVRRCGCERDGLGVFLVVPEPRRSGVWGGSGTGGPIRAAAHHRTHHIFVEAAKNRGAHCRIYLGT